MASRHYSDVNPMGKGNPAVTTHDVREDRGSVNMKTVFSGASLPGASQKRDRSLGVKRAPIYPASKGL